MIAAAGDPRGGPLVVSIVAVDALHLERLRPFVEMELRRLAFSGAVSPAAALRQIFLALYGARRPLQERRRFFSFAAPLARRISLEVAPADEGIGSRDISVAELAEWFAWLDASDPTTAKIVDLHCFADLSLIETAITVGLPFAAVVRKLREAIASLNGRAARADDAILLRAQDRDWRRRNSTEPLS